MQDNDIIFFQNFYQTVVIFLTKQNLT